MEPFLNTEHTEWRSLTVSTERKFTSTGSVKTRPCTICWNRKCLCDISKQHFSVQNRNIRSSSEKLNHQLKININSAKHAVWWLCDVYRGTTSYDSWDHLTSVRSNIIHPAETQRALQSGSVFYFSLFKFLFFLHIFQNHYHCSSSCAITHQQVHLLDASLRSSCEGGAGPLQPL